MKITNLVGRCVKRKTMLVWVKEYINKNFPTCRSLCNFQELYTAFKEKHPNVNMGFANFWALRPKWCVQAGSKMTHSACICSAHQNVALLVDAMNWDLSCKDLIKLTWSCLKHFHQNLFAITFISPSHHKSIFLTGASLAHLISKCSW